MNVPSPTKSTETQATSARTQSTQTIRRSGDERSAPDTSCLYPYKPAAAVMPRRSGHPGVRRWSPEDGGEGLRRVLLLRPLVPPQGANKIYRSDEVFLIEKAKRNDQRITSIPYKSPRMMWYAPLVKQEKSPKNNVDSV